MIDEKKNQKQEERSKNLSKNGSKCKTSERDGASRRSSLISYICSGFIGVSPFLIQIPYKHFETDFNRKKYLSENFFDGYINKLDLKSLFPGLPEIEVSYKYIADFDSDGHVVLFHDVIEEKRIIKLESEDKKDGD